MIDALNTRMVQTLQPIIQLDSFSKDIRGCATRVAIGIEKYKYSYLHTYTTSELSKMGNVVNFVGIKSKYPQPSFPQLETTCKKNLYPAIKTDVQSQELN